MQIDNDTLKIILDEIKPSLEGSLKEELRKTMVRQIQFQFDNQVSEFCKKWIAENIFPELEKQLIESKDGLIKLAISGCEKMVNQMAIGMADSMAKKMESSYERSKVFKALFD